jgi:hypothetical protein
MKLIAAAHLFCVGVNTTLILTAAGSFSTLLILGANIGVGLFALSQLEAK